MDKNAEIRARAAISMIPKSDPDYDSKVNHCMALNGALAERTGEEEAVLMRLDDAARDRLIFYGRQDAAHALLNTITLLQRAKTTNRLLAAFIVVVIVLIVAVVRR